MDFSNLADVFDILEKQSKRTEMAERFADLLKKTDVKYIKKLIYISQGILLPPFEGVELGLGEQLGVKAIANAYGYPESKVHSVFEKKGDLGSVAESFCEIKKQSNLFPKTLSLDHVYEIFFKIARSEGKGSQDLKIKLLVELLSNAKPNESKFIVRFVMGELRLGIREATIIDGLSMAKFGDKSYHDKLDRAFNITSDLGYVAQLFMTDTKLIDSLRVTPFKPLMPALAERLPTSEDILKKMGGKCAVEVKYDGMRMQVHKKGSKVEIYSRKLEKLTHMFPDIVMEMKKLSTDEIILEGESLAYNEKQNKFLSFQETMHRRRKYGVDKLSKEFPMYLFAFDIMYINGKDLTDEPYKERRKYLESLFPFSIIKPSEKYVVTSSDKLNEIFEDAISRGLEGIIAKDLNAPYTAGKRKFAWIKLKKSYGSSMDTVDAVIVGYYLGKGHRTEFGIGGVLVAVYNVDRGMLETIARVGGGFSEDEMVTLKKNLDMSKIESPDPRLNIIDKSMVDVWVQPKYVIEVAFDNITISSIHSCCYSNGKGYALRFPRIVRFREDKSLEDITTSNEVKRMFEEQGSYKNS